MTAPAIPARPAGGTARPRRLWRLCRLEFAKLAAWWRIRLVLLACAVGPVVFVLVTRAQPNLPTDTLFGRWTHASGYASPLVLLGWAGQWLLPAVVGIVAGDVFSSEDRQGTWRTLLVHARSVRGVFLAKSAVVVAYTVAVVAILAVSATVSGVALIGSQPLIGLDGQVIPTAQAWHLVLASWLTALAPALTFATLGLLFSAASGRSSVGVGAPVLLGLVLQLVALAPLPVPVRTALPSTAFSTWYGLFTVPAEPHPIEWGLAVSAAWTGVAGWLAYRILTRRDFVSDNARAVGSGEAAVVALVLALVTGAVAWSAAAGPAATGVTRSKVDAAVATAFARLYQLQQAELGHSVPEESQVSANAACDKGGPDVMDAGPGNDWRCVVTWRVAGSDMVAHAVYQLDVSADGRYVADGDGPKEVNGYFPVLTPTGSRTNPLWQFDGVLDLLAAPQPST